MSYFPMMVSLEGRDILVVGGGAEGTAKLKVLRQFGARITLVAETVSDEARELADTVCSRKFEDADILRHDYVLAVAATNDTAVNQRISALCREEKIPVNVVDSPLLCTFIFPAIVKEGDVVCAVSSGGKSPALTQYIKKKIKDILPENIGLINDRMGEIRERAKEEISDRTKRRQYLRKKLEELMKHE